MRITFVAQERNHAGGVWSSHYSDCVYYCLVKCILPTFSYGREKVLCSSKFWQLFTRLCRVLSQKRLSSQAEGVIYFWILNLF